MKLRGIRSELAAVLTFTYWFGANHGWWPFDETINNAGMLSVLFFLKSSIRRSGENRGHHSAYPLPETK